MILNIEKYIPKYIYANLGTKDGDVYYCDCGEVFVQESKEDDIELKKEIAETGLKINNMSSDDDMISEFQNIFKGVKLGFEGEIHCPKCARNFQSSTNRETLILNKESFISGYSFKEDDESVNLHYSVIQPNLDSLQEVHFLENIKTLTFNKETKKLFYSDFNELPIEFDLDKIIEVVNKFFVFNTVKIVNLFDMHLFINRIANSIQDSKNINIVNELLSSLHAKVGDAGLDVIKKIVIIFFGIIRYSNLSTIAITKGSIFLYDLMLECKIPKPQVLIDNNVTSPIKIFNFLIQNYVNKLNEEINSDNKDVHNFTFKSKQRINFDEKTDTVEIEKFDEEQIVNIAITQNSGYKEGKVKRNSGQYQVEDAITDGTISKFIFKKIRNFSDYKKIIKFFKIVDKNELIQLLQKYELDFLLNVIDLLYFRNKVNMKELERILDIVLDFTTFQSKQNCPIMDGIVRMNYEFVKRFNFIVYDDTLMMMEVLKFDPKIHFNRIRTWNELNEYHDNLIKFFGVLKDEEKNGSIMDFVSKFRFLENKDSYDGPLDIVLLSTPGMIINEGIEMRHSASAYARNVAQGFYLMGQVYDKDPNRTDKEPPRYTIGFTYNKLAGLEFDQVKGFANELGEGIPKKTDRFKKLMMEWLAVKDISYRPINDLKLSGENLTENDSML